MLHALPITNVGLSPCHVAAEQLTSVAGGHYCAACQRTVHDFTQATAAELADARAAAPDGRLCGRFRRSQLAPESRPAAWQLRPRLRQFLLAAVLVMVQGLSARQAWAQAQQRPVAPFQPATEALYQLPGSMLLPSDRAPLPARPDTLFSRPEVFGMMVEQMPVFPGGQDAMLQFLRKHLHYPTDTLLEGRVFVGFVIDSTGLVRDARIVRSLHPLYDAEALRVVRLMPRWEPGRQNGQPSTVSYTLPLTFTYQDDKPARKATRQRGQR